MQGILQIINISNRQHFNYLPINKIETANVTITLIDFCVNSNDIEIASNVLSILTDSPLFTFSFVTALKFSYDTAHKVLQKLKLFLQEKPLKSHNSFFHKLFLKTINKIDSDDKIFTSFNPRDNLTYISTHLFETPSFITEFIYCYDLYLNIYITLLNEYSTFPSLSISYIIYQFPLFLNEKLKKNDFEKELKEDVLNVMKSSAYKFGLKFILNQEFLEKIFEDPPLDVFDDSIFEYASQYPKISKKFLDMVLFTFESLDYEKSIHLIKKIMKCLSDFAYLIGVSRSEDKIFRSLIRLCENSITMDDFILFLNLMLYILYNKWNSGISINRQNCINFVLNEVKDKSLSYFLYYFLICTTDEVNTPKLHLSPINDWSIFQQNSPMNLITSFFSYLMTRQASVNLNEISSVLKSCNVFWLPVMVWAIIFKPPNIKVLFSIPYYQSDLFKTYFSIMMVQISNPFQIWLACQNYPNYDMKIKFPPQSLNTVLQFIQRDIHFIETVTTLHHKYLVNIFLSWRAWVKIFGINPFFEKLLDFLGHYATTRPDSTSLTVTYSTAALLFLSSLKSVEVNMAEMIISYAKNSLKDLRNPIYYSVFSIILVLNYKDRDKNLSMLYKYVDEVLENTQCCSSPQVVFALSFLRNSMHIVECYKYINEKILERLIALNDWQTAIDIILQDVSNKRI